MPAYYTLSDADRILMLQGTIGNRAVKSLLDSHAIQAKLDISRPGDIYEREADLTEEAVMETSAQIQPRITPIAPRFQDDQVEEGEEEEEILQPERSPGQAGDVAPDLASGFRELEGQGRPLAPFTRDFFEARLGFDFRGVQVHTNARAGSLARALNGQAFTLKPAPYFQDPRKALKRYGTLKRSLNRELRRIRITSNKRLKKVRQIKFLRKIYGRVLGYDPFETIDVMSMPAVKRIIQRKGQTYKITTSHNAVTELVDPKNKDKVKVTFNEEIFKDPLESIIMTALHESVHARQLKSGVPARTFHYGPRKDYYAAVNALNELEAYTMEVNSPFFGTLSRNRQKQLKGFLRQADKKAQAAIKKMNIGLSQYRPFQSMLDKLVPKYKGLREWFKKHPLPWSISPAKP